MGLQKKIYVGDAGTELIFDTGQNINDATARTVEASRPDSTTASILADASGMTAVRFITNESTFDQAGDWLLQPKVTTPAGTWRGETVSLRIYAPFD